MKKKTLTFSILLLLGMSLLLTFRYVEDEYKPKRRRKYYQSQYGEQKAVKFVPRTSKRIDNDVDNKYDIGEGLGDSQNLPNRRDEMLKNRLEALKERSRACEERVDAIVSDSDSIDSEDDFFSRPERVTSALQDVLMPEYFRDETNEFLDFADEYLREFDEIESKSLSTILRAGMICRSSSVTKFLDTAIESFQRSSWSEDQKKDLRSKLIQYTNSSLNSDSLPDNLLFNLNVLRIVASSYDDENDSLFEELDEIYDNISDFEEEISDEFRNNEKIENPSDVLARYLSELELSSDRIRIFISERFYEELENTN